MPNKTFFENMLFNYETSNRTDFRYSEIIPEIKTVYREKATCFRIRPPPLKDIHTLTGWKSGNVSFALMLKPKDIVHTNPRNVQLRYEKPPDLDLEETIKKRPRLVMTPAASLDDISSPEARKLLIDDVYTTTAQRAMREGTLQKDKGDVRAPFPGSPAPSNPITLNKLDFPYVSPEWRMCSAAWDNRQLRAHCDPDKEFYLSRTPKCEACDVTAALEDQKKMAKQMKTR